MPENDIHSLHAELKRLGVKIDNLAELFNHAAHGDGFTRCAAHESRLKHVEDSARICHDRIGGVKKWLVAGLISVVSMLANIVWNMVQTGLRH